MKDYHVISDRAAVFEFFKDRLAVHGSEDFRGIIWVHKDQAIPGTVMQMDQVATAVAFNGFVGKTCCMHTVIQRPECVNREMLQIAFHFAFSTCGVECIFGLVDSTNDKALEFDRRLGFKEVRRIKNAGIDGDLVILEMLKNDCRWLRKVTNGRQIESSTS